MVYGNAKIQKLVDDEFIKNTYVGAINPASINLRLGNTFLVPKREQIILLGDEVEYEEHFVKDGNYYSLSPGEFMLATTKEWIKLPKDVVAFVQGRSSIGRACLSVQNAGFVDPAFFGEITLELKNDGPFPIGLTPGYPVVQLVFMDATDVTIGYTGKYCGQKGATGSRMQQDIFKPRNQIPVN